MKSLKIAYKFIIVLFLLFNERCLAGFSSSEFISTKKEALEYLENIDRSVESKFWPNIKPNLFYDNLQLNLEQPMSFYPGRSTNFCSYGALSYLIMEKDPLGYVKFMKELYTNGEATYINNYFKPSKAVMKAAGTLRFKGILDIRHAEQMWFLVLADKFKGYLNFFNKRYNDGDENTFWAATNLAKFNRMVKRMCGVPARSVGSDLIRPSIKNMFAYLQERMDSSIVSLYINNRVIHKKTHDKIKFSIPTHFIILRQINKENDKITIRYWDYGGETVRELTAKTFRKIIFGVTIIGK